jgi:isopentenyldiphosphate isomerase
MASEKIDIYDENMEQKGQMTRDKAHASGEWHRSIHCWIVRPGTPGYVLFQKRGRDKRLFPNMLDITAAGHYSAGEKPEEGTREILEELGLAVQYSDLTPLGVKLDIAKIGDVVNREFCDVYLLSREEAPSAYDINPREVEGLVQISIPEGLKLFSGEQDKALASGVEWNSGTKMWDPIEIQVSVKNVIPRIDPYYLKVFIMAQRMRAGEKYLSI